MNDPQYEISKCKSCGRDIIWATSPTGANLPLDARPVTPYRLQPSTTPPGKIYAVPSEADIKGADMKLRISHFLTCPNAAQHSKGNRS